MASTGVTLRTNDPSKRLTLANIRVAGDPDFFVADLHVLSLRFACDREFYFDRFHADRLIDILEEMQRGTVTEAILKQEWEDEYIRFENDKLGHVIVDGEMVVHGPAHRLHFAIETDQTVLRPFVDEFREALAAAN